METRADVPSKRNRAATSEVGCALPQPAFATIEENRYAHELRLQLRARFLETIPAATLPWSVGAD